MIIIKSKIPTIIDATCFTMLFGGNVPRLELVSIIYGGSRFPTTLNEAAIVTCLLFSKPSTCTCLDPFGSQVLSPLLGTKGTLIYHCSQQV
jgi:hypothetical protein